MDTRPLLTLEEVAERLALAPNIARGMLVRGKLFKWIRIGNRIRVRPEVMEEWLSRDTDASWSGMKRT